VWLGKVKKDSSQVGAISNRPYKKSREKIKAFLYLPLLAGEGWGEVGISRNFVLSVSSSV